MRRKFQFAVTLLVCMMAAFAQDANDGDHVFVSGRRDVLARLEFEADSLDLTRRSLDELVELTPVFLDGALRRYEIHGHFCADADGSRRAAVSRVEALVEYLVLQGVPGTSVLTLVNPARPQRGGRCPADRRVDIMSVELRRVRKSEVADTDVVVDGVIADGIIAAAAPAAPTAPTTAPVVPTVPTTPVVPIQPAAQNRVTVAVYMAGDEPSGIRGMHGILAGELVRAISASEKFIAVDRTEIILEQLAREHEYQRSGAVDDDQIRALGRQLGVQYLCISTVVSVGNGFYVDTRLVDVVTARVIRAVTATSNLRDATEAMRVARETAHELIETEHANRCGRGEETAYNPAYQFCFGGRAYNLCGGGGFNPLTQGCIAGQEVGTKCADGSIVSLGTHCGRHALSTNVAPPIGGTVIRTPDAQVYSADASVALSAVAARGFEFAGWAGAQTSSETSINIRMTRDMPFVAMFRPLNNNALITSAFPANGGTISRVPDSDIYESGEVVAVTAIPARGFEFAGWEGASSSTSRTVNIMIDEGKTLVAIFKPNLHTLNAYATPDIGGSVFINGTALMAATSASSNDFGNMIEAFAQPAVGYVFAGWSGDVSGTRNPIMVDISNSNRTVVANFTPQVQRSTHDTRIVAVSRDVSVDVSAVTQTPTTPTRTPARTTAAARRPPPGEFFTETVGGVSFNMIKVAAGAFTMGCTSEQGTDCLRHERPNRRVRLTRDYYIGEFEVTQELWAAVMADHPTPGLRNPSQFRGENLPVERVSWNNIVNEFIPRLNALTGRNYRLPTEAEWEFAARGGNRGRGYKYAGGHDVNEVAWHGRNSSRRTQSVGTKQPNELGIYDMSGNVWEWVHDRYGNYRRSDRTDPAGPDRGSSRVGRGGGWGNDAGNARVSNRDSDDPDGRDYDIGFRLAVSP